MQKKLNPNAPIGFIDSGVGGLSVVKAALDKLPNEQFIYLGDEARMPYGPRPAQEVIDYTFQMANFLVDIKHIKMLVVACNTATARALPLLQAQLPIPVIGVIEPGVKGALAATHNDQIGVIATQGTVEAGSYQNSLRASREDLSVIAVPTPNFVQMAENGQLSGDAAQREVDATLAALRESGVDTLILGCTHFPFLAPLIQASMGDQVTLVDSGRQAIRQVVAALDELDLWATTPFSHDDDIYYTTDAVERFHDLAKTWLDEDVLDVRLLAIVDEHLEEA